MKPQKLYFTFFSDCEAMQPAVNDKKLGERSTQGICAILESFGGKATLHVIPKDLEASGKMYRRLHAAGHEVGLHTHPAADGYAEFLGIYGPDTQREIISNYVDRFAQAMGFKPTCICLGYGSMNDFTYGILEECGLKHGTDGIATRILPECASVSAGCPLDLHYAHRYNRCLVGDMDFVELPHTLDPDSRMWGGKHPQDLRVELVDAKNHFYVIKKAVERQIRDDVPIKHVRGCTHNTFEYRDKKDFRRQTMIGMIQHAFNIAKDHGMELTPVTSAQLADAYRKAVPLGSTVPKLQLDRSGYGKKKPA
jgi:peptidoglycan/xylan/chitin deacetylase (PgdA/CDA1 family)